MCVCVCACVGMFNGCLTHYTGHCFVRRLLNPGMCRVRVRIRVRVRVRVRVKVRFRVGVRGRVIRVGVRVRVMCHPLHGPLLRPTSTQPGYVQG